MSSSKGKPLLLITGGAGYLGSNLIREALFAGYRVRCLDLLVYGARSIVGLINHPDFELVPGDIRKSQDVLNAFDGVSEVVHLAAIVGDRPCQVAPKLSYEINYEGTCRVAEEAVRRGVQRFIFSSTCSNYGIIANPEEFADENEPLNPVSLYAETKIDCEKRLLSLMSPAFRPTILRFGTAFGISFRTRFDLLINSFVYEAMTKKRMVIIAPNVWRPWVHVHDISRIILESLKAPIERVGGEIFNAGSTAQNYTKAQIVEMIHQALPETEIHYARDVDDKRNYRINFRKLESAIGFLPHRTVLDGIHEMIFAFKHGLLTDGEFSSNNLDALVQFYKDKEKVL